MRHVRYNPDQINYPDGWLEKAQAALEKIRNKPDAEKSVEVKKNDLWKELKPELKKIMHDKCWYTEALQVGTDTDVDHFRPKNSVKGVVNSKTHQKHNGYWWLAFDPSNYRFSCIIANRKRTDLETGIVGGKADEFPLWDETFRAWCDQDDCDNEEPLLIDPCNSVEVKWISFAENGEAIERYSIENRPKAYQKANKSILLYNLNNRDFVKERIKIRDKIKILIKDAQKFYKKMGTEDSEVNDELAYRRIIENLLQLTSEEAPFSSFALAMLQPYKMEEYLEGVFP